MTTPNIEVKIRAPRFYLNSMSQYYTDFAARDPKYKTFNNILVPKSQDDISFLCIKGTPSFGGSALTDYWYWDYYGSGTWVMASNSFGLGENNICQLNVASTHSHIFSKTYYEEYTCPIMYGRWAPSLSDSSPLIYIYPRVDFNKLVYVGDETYSAYFSTLILTLSSDAISVYEYEYDNYSIFDSGTPTINKVHSIPLGSNKDIAVDNNFYFSIGLIPLGIDGVYIYGNVCQYTFGEIYYSRIERNNLPLLSSGYLGVTSATTGSCLFALGHSEFSEGYIESDILSKSQYDTQWPTITWDSFEPEGTSITGALYDENGNAINEGDSFYDFKYKVTLSKDLSSKKTPVIFNINIDFSGTIEEYIDDGIDISDDIVMINQHAGIEVGDFSATIKLRNEDGKYNWLLERVMHELVYTVDGVPKALLYTGDMDFNLYVSPLSEILFAQWEAGDGWKKLSQQRCMNMPPLDGKTAKEGLELFFSYLGWDSSRLDIEDVDFEFPLKLGGQDYFVKPEEGEEASEFLKKVYNQFFSTMSMYFDGEGKFVFKTPDESIIAKKFFMSYEDSVEAYNQDVLSWMAGELPDHPDMNDYQARVMGDVQVKFKYSEYVNEIWVIGYDMLSNYLFISFWMDIESLFNPYYPYYIGDRRPLILITNFPYQGILDYVCANLVQWRGKPRTAITFNSTLDPILKPGDFIQVWPYQILYRITSIEDNAEPGNVSYQTGKIINSQYNCEEWVVGLEQTFSGDYE